MGKPIQDYWPSFYEEIKDFVELAATEDAEMQLSRNAIDQLFSDQFVMTSGVDAIKRREKMLGIQADPSTESLDFRRKRIVNRYSTKPPFTIRYLQEQLDRLVGKGLTVVSVDVQSFILTVTTNIENANVFKEVISTVDRVKPANLIYQQNTSLNNTIELEEHISMREIAWNYALGSWALGEKAFSTLGTEVQIT
ncbi:putative phage tail protein [Cohnella caldifontis]|uniref:putative phage tail protein n=1 Tax=Cohnella caldifontis TaxID=3027471 RepID=UPI0023EBE2A0|nr:putative phage tail protein [Cohnella sp. YIM B05605]